MGEKGLYKKATDLLLPEKADNEFLTFWATRWRTIDTTGEPEDVEFHEFSQLVECVECHGEHEEVQLKVDSFFIDS